MKFLLLGLGKTINSIKKFLNYKKVKYIHAVFENEYKRKYELADESLLLRTDIDYVIKSPGISETNKIYLELKNKFKVISELDLFTIFNINTKVIAITGSNGKSTLVEMLKFVLTNNNINCISCGNSHNPIFSYFKKFDEVDYLICELSSYQLTDLKYYKPYISTIINLQANHLDHVYSLKSYFESKKNIYKYQDKNCYFILNDIKELKNIECNANVIKCLHFDDIGKLSNQIKKYKLQIDICYTIVTLLNIDTNSILKLNEFKCLKYREEITLYKNITVINDSKSTTVDATLFALKHINNLNETILIIGGKDKQISYTRLNNVKPYMIICYGEISHKVKTQVKNVVFCNNLNDAILLAKLIKLDRKIILFSPAASSVDQYKSFEQRGKEFDKNIRRILHEK